MKASAVTRALFPLLAGAFFLLPIPPSLAQEIIRPKMMVILDTSYTMTYTMGYCPCDPDCQCDCNQTASCEVGCDCDPDCSPICGCDQLEGTCDIPNTYGDGSQDWPGVVNYGESRMQIAKTALLNALYGTFEIDFGLMRYWQREGEDIRCCMATSYCYIMRNCYTNCCMNYSGLNPDSCEENGGEVLVDIGPYSHDEMIMWMDGVENYPADKELRADGETPLATSLLVAQDYFAADVIPGDPYNHCRGFYTVLMTDGLETCGLNPVASAQALRSTDVGGTAYDVKTFVIGFGADVDGAQSLRDIASAGGTDDAYFAGDLLTLQTAINEIIQRAIPVEICDGLDNDCDGDIDEDLIRPCSSACGLGTETCLNGQWRNCDAPPVLAETCNDLDDDCDSQVDEDLTRICSTECGDGVETCIRGAYLGCTAPTPQVEVCDGDDNDCDGLVDEDVFEVCSTVCGNGVRLCENGLLGDCDAPTPQPEVCDGVDNDCDNQIDELLTRSCSNDCGTGTETCVAGSWVNCSAPQPQPEVCDGVDNDCDGSVDEEITRPCASACGQGEEFCQGGFWVNCNAPRPQVEVCDGVDNDCDNRTDENLVRPCSNSCGTGTEVCSGGEWINCSAPRPQIEVCDGADNDCDGVPDDGLTRVCSTSCGAGLEYCINGGWTDCNAPHPQPEICDGLDNNCNGHIDEGLSRDCYTACGNGVEICNNGSWTNCSASQPQTEVCDGVDNDCDGQVDENIMRSCSNDCGSGIETCFHGTWTQCTAPQPAPEICDGLDNDCDGVIDDGLTRPCFTQCGNGEETCVGGVWTNCTAQAPHPEICDGQDNDCDGQSDENLERICYSNCGTGKETCWNGSWGGCTAPPEQPETCDGQDNDCDGMVDEGLTLPCSSQCGEGVMTCVNGEYLNCNARQPQVEVCDGLDNDCDTLIDEALFRDCHTVCGSGQERCMGGLWVACTAPQPVAEMCDGLDNDCNGLIDENLTQACSNACGSGVETCQAGLWVNCTAPQPQVEICDGFDNDCNGTADDGLSRECFSVCGSGTETCQGGVWGGCTAPQASPEQCDGLDNDCDGHIDEGLSQVCQTACGRGYQRCEGGSWTLCDARQPQPETCNGSDDDCDGIVDNDLTRPCHTECGDGVETCSNGVWGFCSAAYPSLEVCDGLDNDCDGHIDEELSRACSTACGQGEETCQGGLWQGCTAPQPDPEVCDGADNNCDGLVDENLIRSCSNGCGSGTETCHNGTWSQCTAPPPSDEVCDGQDNDCDGTIDEELTRECFTECGQGVETCETGSWGNCDALQPRAEECDGLDNNCDGHVDENLIRACASPCGAGMEVCEGGAWTSCNAPLPQPEVCDGADNDCDGQIDNDLIQPCQTDCGDGMQICFMGEWGTCIGPNMSEEICDDVDNDCDGEVDEDLTRECHTACGDGEETCEGGDWVGCTALVPEREVCDGIDNNCDGLVDEGLVRACDNECGWGFETCFEGEWMGCTAPQAQSEICDGLDNDCDTLTDEELNRSCFTACGEGIEICINGGWTLCNAPQPQPETCDGLDNDCDGLVDDGVVEVCSTACGSGIRTCVDGSFTDCSARQPSPEVCDNQDNDCNGAIDDGLTRPCSNDCGTGTEACVGGRWMDCSAPRPMAEVCDGLDNDCDQTIDEDVTRPCSNACGEGVETCSSGAWVDCNAPQPTEEVCDGKDNDCDGEIDEAVTRPCSTDCGEGVETCLAGVWGHCEAPPALPEVCDNQDNDCDGEIDEEVSRTCRTACGEGTQTCSLGEWSDCTAPQPTAEACDGLDNDCDGAIDDDLIRPCYTACGSGQEVCQNGEWLPCSAPIPLEEVCDGQDNDCDGLVDEDIQVMCLNECGSGVQLCVNGVLTPCDAPEPGPELCDCWDNDCDGVVDGEAANEDCEQGTYCVACQCAMPCQMGECPVSFLCVDDYCLVDLCYGVHCTGGRVCTDGMCMDPTCVGIDCGPGLVCDKGDCVELTCYLVGCPAGWVCSSGRCVEDPCVQAGCGDDEACRDGLCLPSCATVLCEVGEVCRDGACVADPCALVECSPGQTCQGGECVPDPCTDQDCPTGLICLMGECVEDPCLRVSCPEGQFCEEGQCQTSNPLDPEGLTDPDAGDGGLGDGGSEGDGPSLRGDGDVLDLDLGPISSPDGCGCSLEAGSASPATLAIGLVALLGLLALRRRPSRGKGGLFFILPFLGLALLLAPGCGDDTTTPPPGDEDVAQDPCSLGYYSAEMCNGEDDDCDGEIDEDYDLATDSNHCGACGHLCRLDNARSYCEEGECQVEACIAGYRDDDGDPGNGCEALCTVTGTEACDGVDNDCDGLVDEDFDLRVDPDNCGQCGSACSYENATARCVFGTCALADCRQGWANANGDPSDGCETECEVSNNGFETCDGVDNNCDGRVDEGYDKENDPANCGECDNRCDLPNALVRCMEGECAFAGCEAGFADVDGNSDNGCESDCLPSGMEVCDGVDNDCDGVIDNGFDLTADPNNCGACGFICAFANAVAGCEASHCTIASCQEGFANADRSLDNGCEAVCHISGDEVCDEVDNDCDGLIDEDFDLTNDPGNCGACDNLCVLPHAVAACQRGLCAIASCEAGHSDLDRDPENGCEHICTPTEPPDEVCDKVDNDCDGLTDEGFALDRDPANCGSCGHRCDAPDADMACVAGECVILGCEAGTFDANGSVIDGCEYSCSLTHNGIEICDELDNDCDGLTDEGFDLDTDRYHCGECNHLCNFPNASALCQAGQCIMGDCLEGFSDANGQNEDGCEIYCDETNGGVEACDYLDNDCNGLTDEGFDLQNDGENCGSCGHVCFFANANALCQDGLCIIESCLEGFADIDRDPSNGCEASCTISNGGVEICDDLDNNCDGQVDEGFDLYSDVENCGICGHICQADHAVTLCLREACVIDHCEPGWVDANRQYSDGCELACVMSNGGVEICDEVDNDCDGRVDDGFDLNWDPDHCGRCNHDCVSPNAEAVCLEGECTITRCGAGYIDANHDSEDGCEARCNPSNEGIEICDREDNDCDGLTDEGYDLTSDPLNCGSCNNRCSLHHPNAYVSCEGRHCVMGECFDGFFDFDPEVPGCETPCRLTNNGVEICDRLDNNCNSVVDEGFHLEVDTNNCGSCGHVCSFDNAIPGCREGRCMIFSCMEGWADMDRNPVNGCEAECEVSMGGEEFCDHVDNDCDGLVDEEFDLNTDPANCGECGHICQTDHGTPICLAGYCYVGQCDPGWQNANGDPADGCELECVPSDPPVEVCDDQDNDCDGLVDDGFNLLVSYDHCGGCNQSCNRPHAVTYCNQGECAIIRCEEEYADQNGDPVDGCEVGCRVTNNGVEACDNVDNDCDGETDEIFDLLTDVENCGLCGHACYRPNANMECDQGQCILLGCQEGWQDSNNDPSDGCELPCTPTDPPVEACDGLDNDCNGEVDELWSLSDDLNNCGSCGHICDYPHALATCLQGICLVGECEPGWVDRDRNPLNGCEVQCTITNNGVEACDGEDNDCDGLTDEDFNLISDEEHCGACNNPCDLQDATTICLQGRCLIESCHEGFVDANGVPNDGCELECTPTNEGVEICDHVDNDCDSLVDDGFDLDFDINNCGLCGHVCDLSNAEAVCNEGTCEIRLCLPGYMNANGDHEDGCERECTISNDGVEACDGLDNDCNGEADEGFNLVTDPMNCGACGHACHFHNALSSCVNRLCVMNDCLDNYHDFNDDQNDGCEAYCEPEGPEVCDGRDNNCDGRVDELWDLMNDPNNCGECGRICSFNHAVEGCDEGFCTIASCEPGWSDADRNPINGCEFHCTVTNGGVEACDGLDNDCDGLVDEDFNTGIDPQNCGECGEICSFPHAVAGCTAGYCYIEECLAGWWNTNGDLEDGCELPCTPTNPTTEICDGQDNDCDGIVDNGIDVTRDVNNCGSCGHVCDLDFAFASCVDSECLILHCEINHFDNNGDPEDGCEFACAQTPGGVEICDNMDNDCDGLVDEDYHFLTDINNCGFCGNDCVFDHALGFCNQGTCEMTVCYGGFKDLNGDPADGCEYGCSESNGGIEACDGLDNDCDGVTDEGFDLLSDVDNCGVCGHECLFLHAVPSCHDAACIMGDCLAGWADMDHDPRNGCEAPCTITNGGTEICDSRDNDCDGYTDEGFDLQNDPNNCGTCNNVCTRAHTSMYCNAGECDVISCSSGWNDANGDPSDGCECQIVGPEVCNGLDDDCSGVADDNLPGPPPGFHCLFLGVCQGSTPVCRGVDGWGCNYPATYDEGVEIHCDNLDNDCDGWVDDDFGALGGVCYSGHGVCRGEGTLLCAADTIGAICTGEEHPENQTEEVCNGQDDDCDGETDEDTDELIQVGGAWMYKYEASRTDSSAAAEGISFLRSCSKAGVLPWTNADWATAALACEAAGMRLCTEEEWIMACGGTGSRPRAYPYGTAYEPLTCNGHDYDIDPLLPGVQDGLVTTGEALACEDLEFGVMDLSGNVWEWVLDDPTCVCDMLALECDLGCDCDPYCLPCGCNQVLGLCEDNSDPPCLCDPDCVILESPRIFKGGSYGNIAQGLTCTYFNAAEAGSYRDNIGFRCCSL